MHKFLFNFFSVLLITNLSASSELDNSSSWDSSTEWSTWDSSNEWDSSSEWWNTGWDSSSEWDSSWTGDSNSGWNSGWASSWDSSSNWDSSSSYDSGWDSSMEAVQMSGMDVMQTIFSDYYAGHYTNFLSELDSRWESMHAFDDKDSSGFRAGTLRYDLENIRAERDRSLGEIVSKYPDTNVSRILSEVLGYSLDDSEVENLQYFMFDKGC